MIHVYTIAKRTPFIARKIARKMGTEVLRKDVIPTKVSRGDIIFNYGGSTPPKWDHLLAFMDIRVVNHWDAVDRSVDKIKSFAALNKAGVPTLEWCTSSKAATNAGWGRTVVRALTRSTKAKGVSVIDPPSPNSVVDELPDAPLYTRYWPKTHEFRVHVFDDVVIDYTQKKMISKEKRKERGIVPVRFIRSYDNGWIFSRNDIIVLPEIRKLALDATKAVGLDYCGVDILARLDKKGNFKEAVVCETNSAPGMQNTTFKNYMNKINNLEVKR